MKATLAIRGLEELAPHYDAFLIDQWVGPYTPDTLTIGLLSKPKTRNPKPETRDPNPET